MGQIRDPLFLYERILKEEVACVSGIRERGDRHIPN